MKICKRESYLNNIRGFYYTNDIIKVITGIRRCGKSSLMKMIAEEIKAANISEKNIIFIDLDTEEFRKIKTADQLEKVIKDKTLMLAGLKFLFIDEIQNVVGFEEIINNLNNKGDYSIFITGSNSYLLSGELITKLVGRYIEFEMFTLSFQEYENMKKFYGQEINPNPLAELNNYILEGGFPRTLTLTTIGDKRTYTQSVINEIFEKDIKRRIKIKDRDAFNNVKNFVINNFGSLISINAIVATLKKNGTPISKVTVAKYIQTLIDAKIISVCDRFDLKSKKTISGEKKYYIADLSFYYALHTNNQLNLGPCLENIVYIYAKSHDYSVSVGQIGKVECDFILRDRELNYAYVQVSYTVQLDKKTQDREFKPLEQIKDNYPKYVATTDFSFIKRNGIKHINIIDFMKDNKLF